MECCSILSLTSAEVDATSVAGQDVGAHVCQASPVPALSATRLEIPMGWPFHNTHVVRLQILRRQSRRVWAGIILLENDVSVSVGKRNNHRCQDFIFVALGVEIPVDDYQICLPVMANTRPHHNRPSAESVCLFDASVTITLTGTTVNKNTSIRSLQGEYGLI